MDFFDKLSRQLLKNNAVSDKRLRALVEMEEEDEEFAELFYNLALRRSASDMAYHEHKRATHLMYKSTFESFT
ncbi:hypothetical protein [Pseudomonas marginalis]|uniref:hypothetical protein n=1 Tax=Pseudomonas marginalis TaxID=298 RepID=UPI0034D4CCC9